MIPTLLLSLACGHQAPAAAQTPAELLERARAAARAFDGARYDARYVFRLELANRIWRLEGEVARWSEDGVGHVAIEAGYRAPLEEEPTPIVLTRQGGAWQLVDHGAKRAFRGTTADLAGDPSHLAAGLDAGRVLGDPWYAGEEPVSAAGPEVRPDGTFWKLVTRSPDGLRETTWHLSADDLLPRSADRVTRLDRLERLFESVRFGRPVTMQDGGPPMRAVPEGYARAEALGRAPVLDLLAPPREREVVVVEMTGLEDLRRRFEAARGKRRIVGLFAPT